MGGRCKACDPLLRLSRVLDTRLVLGFFIWQKFALRFTETIQIYNTLDAVSAKFAPPQLFFAFELKIYI